MLVISYLEKFGGTTHKDIDDFPREKISDALSAEQKSTRVRNLLQEMRREGTLFSEGRGPGALWNLAKPAGDTEN